tara:strand:- start:2514 stop:3011 length:498 start_codon:yes stop_codon:yes gene_type:complete
MSFQKPLRIPGRRKVLTKNMILDAQTNSKSASECARWLGVSFNTYKKWAQYYKVYDNVKNQSGKGIKKGFATYRISLEDIFEGKTESKYTDATFKKRLVNEGYMQEECSVCGFNEGRITDGKIPLHIDYIDGDRNNKSFDNLRLLCPNHYFLFNGNFPQSKQFVK